MIRSRSASSIWPSPADSRCSQNGIRSGSPAAAALALASRYERKAESTAAASAVPSAVSGPATSSAMTTLFGAGGVGLAPKSLPQNDIARSLRTRGDVLPEAVRVAVRYEDGQDRPGAHAMDRRRRGRRPDQQRSGRPFDRLLPRPA